MIKIMSFLPFHNEFERKSYKTNEFVFVEGKLQSDLYTEQGEFIETIVDEGEGILLPIMHIIIKF